MRKLALFIVLFITVVYSCRKAYQPRATSTSKSYLVVEGVISSGSDTSFIKLSRTVTLADSVKPRPELNAVITIEGDQNISYPVTDMGNGTYAYAGLTLDNTHQYRLDIRTADNQQYVSDYTPVLDSPPIDSVSFTTTGSVINGPGLSIFVNTHDPTNKIKYFRWEYQETWIFHAYFHSYFYSNGDTVLGRGPTQNISDCWGNDTSSTILLGSTAKLSQDVIANNLVTFVPSTSEKVQTDYSIIVKQYALTTDAYNFYSTIKQSSEQLGSIFDPLPTTITGNIHCVSDPSKIAIGYVSAGRPTSQRIFVPVALLPEWNTIQMYNSDNCKLEFSPQAPCCYYASNQVNEYINYNIGHDPDPFIPIDAIGLPGSPPIGYTAATRACSDCTLRGTNKRPAFWQ